MNPTDSFKTSSINSRQLSSDLRHTDPDGQAAGEWWHEAADGRIACDLCPRDCHLKPGDRGFCFVRQNVDGQMKLTTYGRSTGFCIDPIEKKPLNHFFPGSPVLSFGTAGCNLGCKFCQNWDISKSREVERLSELAMPESIAAAALKTGCRSVAFTYNDPVIWAEYAIDTARECRQLGIHPVAVTAGYITPSARAEFFHAMDAANVDLKAFTEDFYERITYSKLQPVLDTLHWLKHESDVWFEITNLIIPDANDSPDELRRMCDWILESVGAEVPVHFSAFHPDFRMTDRPRTPHETLVMARDIAVRQGLKFVYIGNVNDVFNQSTWCPGCGELLIERNWYQLGLWNLDGNVCRKCRTLIPGRFDKSPGSWGNRRQPIRISEYAAEPQVPSMLNRSLLPQLESNNDDSPEDLHAPPAPILMNSRVMNTLKTAPELSLSQQQALLLAACEIVAAAVNGTAPHLSDPSLGGLADLEVMGVFVTLKKSGQLRGCVGMLGEPMKICDALLQAGHRTAVADQRFAPVAAHELPHLTLDVTILFNFETIHEIGEARTAAIEVGKHGLRIIHQGRSGLLLPIVAVEQQWDARTFLEQVCRKAGLSSNAWLQPDSQLLRFEGRLIEGPFSTAVAERAIQSSMTLRSTLPSQDYVRSLATFVTANIRSLAQGAIPACFPSHLSDQTVDGLAIQLALSNGQRITFSKLQPSSGVPLQMTLLELAQSAANWLQQSKTAPAQISADVLLLLNAEQLKSLNPESLSRLNPEDTLLLLTDGSKTTWRFQRKVCLEQTLQQLFQDIALSDSSQAGLFRFTACCSCDEVSVTSRPQPQQGPALRKPAVAGKFYPASPKALAGLINSCLGRSFDESISLNP
jgi:AmmeMemoRadiSam system radical SAM enzyme/AmmeMemoRadiSam system protein A